MKNKILMPLMLFYLASCTNSDEQNDASRNKSAEINSNEIQKDSSLEENKSIKKTEVISEIKKIKQPKKVDKKTFILGTWNSSKAGRSVGKTKFSKNGEWYAQKKNKTSWKKLGNYKLSKDCKSITVSEGGRKATNLYIETYTSKKIVIFTDQRHINKKLVLTK